MVLAAAAILAGVASASAVAPADLGTRSPHPIRLRRPPVRPLSAMALLGREIFFDPALSQSGKTSCASCHRPEFAYGPVAGQALPPGGARATPSLRYVQRTPSFSIGPDDPQQENVDIVAAARNAQGVTRPQKQVGSTAASVAMVPQGGLFWDGRANTLQEQAMGPLFNRAEMANVNSVAVASVLRHAPYAGELATLFGPSVFSDPKRTVDEAMFAVGRFQIEDPSFHPYTSKYDAYLEGTAGLTAAQLRGLSLFRDKDHANCAGCHPDQPTVDGTPPLFTDFQYEALGAPRNSAVLANHDPRYFDLGLCGPVRADLREQAQYCGMFRTPSLRNVALRSAFFHNGVYRDLKQVLAFYNFREVQPEKVYRRGAGGELAKFDDLPKALRVNVDVLDSPFNRKRGDVPAMTEQDMRDLITFLGTLTDADASPVAPRGP